MLFWLCVLTYLHPTSVSVLTWKLSNCCCNCCTSCCFWFSVSWPTCTILLSFTTSSIRSWFLSCSVFNSNMRWSFSCAITVTLTVTSQLTQHTANSSLHTHTFWARQVLFVCRSQSFFLGWILQRLTILNIPLLLLLSNNIHGNARPPTLHILLPWLFAPSSVPNMVKMIRYPSMHF